MSEWLTAALLVLGFWNKGWASSGPSARATFVTDRHHHPLHAGRLGRSAAGFPAMVGNVAFLMKDFVLFAVSVYLLKQDVERVMASPQPATPQP